MSADPFPIPFRDLLHISVLSAADGESHLVLPFSDLLTNLDDTFHGGALMTALDIAMAYAAGSTVEGAMNAVTIDFQAQFLRPARGDLHVWGHVKRAGRRIAFCEARAVDGRQETVATGEGAFKIRLPGRLRRPGSAGSPADQPGEGEE